MKIYDGRRRYEHRERSVACVTCGAEPETSEEAPQPCRTTSGRRMGRAVSYHHRARVDAWHKRRKMS